jgi:uncharacterized protein with von Willebrand factor type A (vWA) domain
MTPPPGKLADAITRFARLLRAAGLTLGPGTIVAAIRAVELVGLARREDVYWALHAHFVSRHDQHDLFDQAFALFWSNPRLLENFLAALLPEAPAAPAERAQVMRRLAEALGGPEGVQTTRRETLERDARWTASPREVLQSRDFEKMSLAEIAQAKQAITGFRPLLPERPTRRWRPAASGAQIDARRSFRASLRGGGDFLALRRRSHAHRPTPLVVLTDISGSMDRYARLFLHFMHAITNDRDRVHSFVFGTRLTPITRHLRQRDVDVALEQVSAAVADWAGGTRIGHCLRAFNRDWARRVLGQGATVVLVTDGLERDADAALREQMARLRRSCRRLIWLNPLLRYDAFEPRARGVQAILPFVDRFLPVHNLEALGDLAAVLTEKPS